MNSRQTECPSSLNVRKLLCDKDCLTERKSGLDLVERRPKDGGIRLDEQRIHRIRRKCHALLKRLEERGHIQIYQAVTILLPQKRNLGRVGRLAIVRN